MISTLKSDDENEESLRPQVIPKPAPDRSASSKSTGRIGLQIMKRSANKQPHKTNDLEISDYLTTSSKVFKSAEAYNKLLETRQKERKERSASLRQKREKEQQLRLEGKKENNLKDLGVIYHNEVDGPISFITAVSFSKKSSNS